MHFFLTEIGQRDYSGPNLFWDGCNEIKILGPEIVDYLHQHSTNKYAKIAIKRLGHGSLWV